MTVELTCPNLSEQVKGEIDIMSTQSSCQNIFNMFELWLQWEFVIAHKYSITIMYRWRYECEIARLVSSASTLIAWLWGGHWVQQLSPVWSELQIGDVTFSGIRAWTQASLPSSATAELSWIPSIRLLTMVAIVSVNISESSSVSSWPVRAMYCRRAKLATSSMSLQFTISPSNWLSTCSFKTHWANQ